MTESRLECFSQNVHKKIFEICRADEETGSVGGIEFPSHHIINKNIFWKKDVAVCAVKLLCSLICRCAAVMMC